MTKKVRRAPKLLHAQTIPVVVPDWIWHPYIPANCSTLLFGVGGIGKSYISVEIAAALSAGRPLPGQTAEQAREYKILLMSAEDHPSAVIKPRLIKCGAKLENIFIPAEAFTLDEWGIGVIKRYMKECGATIVIIDPIVQYMGGAIDMNKMNEVRAVTGALQQSAMASHSAVIIIHHARKGGEGETYEKAAGSADFVNASRSTLFAHTSNDGTAVLEHVKTNYAVYGPAMGFYIDDEGFHWVGHYSEGMLKAAGSHTKRAAAEMFLTEMLKNGPLPSKEIAKMAKDEGLTMTTLNRAKPRVAESVLRFIDSDKVWFWRLKGDMSEPKGSNKTPVPKGMDESEAWLRAHGMWKAKDPTPISGSGTTISAKRST